MAAIFLIHHLTLWQRADVAGIADRDAVNKCKGSGSFIDKIFIIIGLIPFGSGISAFIIFITVIVVVTGADCSIIVIVHGQIILSVG